jgi:hypothetical protein
MRTGIERIYGQIPVQLHRRCYMDEIEPHLNEHPTIVAVPSLCSELVVRLLRVSHGNRK